MFQIGLLDLFPNYICREVINSTRTSTNEGDHTTITVAFLDEVDTVTIERIQNEEEHGLCEIWNHYGLEILRFINHKPLKPKTNSPLELSCDIIQSIKSFNWKKLCFKIGSIYLDDCTQLFLQPLESRYFQKASHYCRRRHKVVITIHHESPQLEFSDFRKDCIRGISEASKFNIQQGNNIHMILKSNLHSPTNKQESDIALVQ